MKKLKIGIVEDEMIIANVLEEMLTAVGYEVTEFACRYSEAITMIENEKPDLLLLDINLLGQKNGIDVAETVRSKYDIPFIFLTANLDNKTIEQAKQVKPSAYLVKPVTKEQLYSAIEIAFSNYNDENRILPTVASAHPQAVHDFIFIKDGYVFRKIFFKDILYLESDANYVTIHLENGKKLMARFTMNDFLEQIDQKIFVRIHRSFVVNFTMIENVFPSEVSVKGTMVAIGKSYKDDLMKLLGLN
jgi:DNA-binding LytR/AlgR family response regulator